MVVAIIQAISGADLAFTSGSSTIKMSSSILGTAALYCIYKAWRFGYLRNIPRHKY